MAKTKLIRVKTPVEPCGEYIVAYCDGSCGFGDRLGGWGYVIHSGLDMHEDWGGAKETTNNLMEIAAGVNCMQRLIEMRLYRRPVVILTDSQYVTGGMGEWRGKWERSGWNKVKNVDEWKEAHQLADRFEHLSFAWIRGHRGHYWNEYVDRLADKGRKRELELRDNERWGRYAANRT